MPKFLSSIDTAGYQVLGLRMENLAAAPGSPSAGSNYYDTGLNAPRFYNGSAWKTYTDRAAHTGTQTASTISDFQTTTLAFTLDQFAAPAANVNINNRRLISVSDPTGAQDAATKNYVDNAMANALAGVDAKPSVRLASTANLTLSGTQTIDGVSAVAGDRVLAKNQTTASANGVYVVAAGAWARATDADATGEITPGAEWYVEEGTANGGSKFRVSNTGTITLGTTSITIILTGGGTTYSAGNGLQLSGTTFSALHPANSGLISDTSGTYLDTTIAVRKAAGLIGDGTTTAISFSHNLGTKDVTVSVRYATGDQAVEVDWVASSTSAITLNFAAAPSSNQFRVTVHG